MKLLLIGYSQIAQKRVFPALKSLGVTQLDIASLSRADTVSLPDGLRGRVFSNYADALAQSNADVVYVSTVNSTHAQWAEESLRAGFHTVVDKPAFLTLSDTERLLKLAESQKLCLAESTVYGYHPQIEAAKIAFAQADSAPTRLTATFSFPPLPADNFRYHAKFGGGALYDLGPYAITPGRLFFGQEPQEIFCHITDRAADVETGFSLLATYSGGRSLVGHFGFNTGYRNRCDILGPGVSVTIDRVFTPPAEMTAQLDANRHNQPETIAVPPADTFANFFRAVFNAIDSGETESLAADMLSDARTLHRLRQATSTKT